MAGISITLAGNFQKLDELKGKAHKTAASIKDSFKNITGNAAFQGLAAGAAAAFAGIVASAKKAIDAGGELSDMMLKTGASGKSLLILQQAFENAGMSANEAGQALNRMQKALAGINEDGEPTNAAFAKLGLSVQNLMALDPAAAFMKIGESIARIQNPAQRAAVAIELFGKSGGNLLAIFNDGGAFSGAAEQLGGLADLLPTISGDADKVGDAIGSLDEKMKQLGAGVVSELMPQLLQFSDWLNKTDFTDAGVRIGMVTTQLGKAAAFMGKVASWTPAYKIGQGIEWLVNDGGNLTEEDRAKAGKMAEGWAAADPGFMKPQAPEVVAEVFNPFEAARTEGAKQAAKEAKQAAKAAEAKAAADAKAAAETEKSRAAAGEEYRLESAILAARLKGDAERLAALEREKAIREEMKRLESAGFTAEEARKPAAAKVDAAKKADDADTRREAAMDEKRRVQEILAGRVNETRKELDNLEYQSSVGSISSMQRIGGGGGAVASGLDYARQNSDLLRELNQGVRQLIEVSRTPPE